MEQIIKRFAEINGISEEEAAAIISDATTPDAALEKIKEFNLKKIREQHPMPSFNRKQRRALKKKMGSEIDLIADAAEKLNYIDLIQKFRALNEKKEKEENENSTENN